MKKSLGISVGKCILLGEHAVVYNYPAIATAINLFSKVIIQKNPVKNITILFRDFNIELTGNTIQELFNNIPQTYLSIILPVKAGLEFWEKKYSIIFSGLIISIESELWMGAGLGSSASISVALFNALQKYFDFDFDLDNCFDFSLQMEKISHGNPSGIDNSICSCQGTIFFQNRTINQLNLSPDIPMHLLVIYSGEPHNTKQAISQINNLKSKDPKRVSEIFQQIGNLVFEGKNALEQGDRKKIQILMENNQKYLEDLGLITDKMKNILTLGKEMNIKGIKMTGAGMGGCLIAYDDSEKLLTFQKRLDERKIQNKLVQINVTIPDIQIHNEFMQGEMQ